MEVKDAREELEKSGWRLRIIEKDGQPIMRTCDLRSNRLCVTTEEGYISSISGIG